MTALALHHDPERSDIRRWTLAAAAILLVHLAIAAAAVMWLRRDPPTGTAIPAIMIDLAPASAPEIQPMDVAPGPEMQEAEPPPPEPARTEEAKAPEKLETIEPTPQQPDPVVAAPQKAEPVPEPEPEKPDLKPAVKPDPAPVKPKQVVAEKKRPPQKQPPAPRTTAAPKAERVGPDTASLATSGAAAAAAAASYRDRLAAHLQRFKQYPSGSRAAGEQGVARLSFTVTRSGAVVGARLAGSSGYGSLDAETLAMIRRAQPLPPVPAEMQQASMSFTVPIRYSLR
jgi:protein TonB